jgi:hypothetical protein
MRRFALLAALATLPPAALLAQEDGANVHSNYNMGTAEYFVGRSDTGGFGFNCQDKHQEGYQERYLIAFTFPDTAAAKGDKVVFSRGSDAVALTMDSSEAVGFDGHKNWDAFTRIWNMVRAGDEISVAVGAHPPVRLATTGAAEAMPASACGE